MLIYNDDYESIEELIKISEHNAKELIRRAEALLQDAKECTMNIRCREEVSEAIVEQFSRLR